ncbi:MAG: hypothetical protein WBB45_18305 [Cyclobacteriaceae bacterium]
MKRKTQLSALKVSSFVTRFSAGRVKGGRKEETLEAESSCIQDYCTFDCEGAIEA